ncbi:MAG: Uncharacterized protein G01um101413_707 [Parcubacteria group bacterium Gr01-1014_13]|nr:MAG: Uncharacterized protein G01um101413_707 [Parcubacteria group bacterium Gr01-1014_13]
MIETSKDILFLVIAFCVLWITVFLCWVFYYVTRILKNANEIAEEFRSRLQILTEAINYVRGKVENIHTLLNITGSGMAGMVKSMVNKKAKDWIRKGSDKMNSAAKEAVDKAVEVTAKKMKKVAKNVKR